MRTIILCGGPGTRLRQETEFRPKSTVEIGGRPILWHIMKIYAHYGHKDFVLALGYKGELIRSYFLNYEAMTKDVTLRFGAEPRLVLHGETPEPWTVTLADTGVPTSTGARLKRLERYIPDDTFMLTYGDGVADVDLDALLAFHRKHGRIATVTGVRPASRFGELITEGSRVVGFSEKPIAPVGSYANGGFFVFKRRVFDYLTDQESCGLEIEVMERLADDEQLEVYPHAGFWQAVDTPRDIEALEHVWAREAPWKVWS
jgi:glucose-1-phosphate cytidylyltransferase